MLLFLLCLHVCISIDNTHFGFQGGTLDLIVSVPGHCLPLNIYLALSVFKPMNGIRARFHEQSFFAKFDLSKKKYAGVN